MPLVLGATGCAGGTFSTVLKVDIDAAAPPTLDDASDKRALLAAVITEFRKLKLPLSSPVYAHFYSTGESFQIGLVTDARMSPKTAREMAAFATGVGTYYGIFVREDRFQRMALYSRVWTLAHELTHVSQAEILARLRLRPTSSIAVRAGA